MCDDFYIELVTNPHVAHDKFFYNRVISLTFFECITT